jgi:hypothetical protein
MDSNIKIAASCLRKAAYNMQARINELRIREANENRQESSDESRIADSLRQDEITIAINANDKNKNANQVVSSDSQLISRDQAMRKDRDDKKNRLNQDISQQNNEIRSLEGQISKLNELARTLEAWPS